MTRLIDPIRGIGTRLPICSPRRRSARGLSCLAVLLTVLLFAPVASAIEQTPPVNLGASGLSLSLRLWKQTAPGASWAAQGTGSITTTDLGTGDYFFGNLPTATGTERYTLVIAPASSPAAALVSTTYGAAPGTRIIWRQELVLPPQPLTFKTGDTFGSIAVQVLRRLPAAACEPATTATFSAWSATTGASAWTGRAATISDCELDSTTSTYGATFTYDLQSDDTEEAGRYLGEFRICYTPSSCHTLPADNRLEWRVVEAFD